MRIYPFDVATPQEADNYRQSSAEAKENPGGPEQLGACSLALADTWRCFHCSFVTSDPAKAQAHFGDRDDAEEFTPICKWWQLMEQDERIATLQDTLQQLNAEREECFKERQRAESAETRVKELEAKLGMNFKDCREYREGR